MRRLGIFIAAVLLVGCSSAMLTGGDYYKKQPRTDGVAGVDATTTTQIERRLADDSVLSGYRIGVTTYNGRVTLTGSVDDFRQRTRAEDIAKQVSGSRTINNQIVVSDGSDPK